MKFNLSLIRIPKKECEKKIELDKKELEKKELEKIECEKKIECRKIECEKKIEYYKKKKECAKKHKRPECPRGPPGPPGPPGPSGQNENSVTFKILDEFTYDLPNPSPDTVTKNLNVIKSTKNIINIRLENISTYCTDGEFCYCIEFLENENTFCLTKRTINTDENIGGCIGDLLGIFLYLPGFNRFDEKNMLVFNNNIFVYGRFNGNVSTQPSGGLVPYIGFFAYDIVNETIKVPLGQNIFSGRIINCFCEGIDVNSYYLCGSFSSKILKYDIENNVLIPLNILSTTIIMESLNCVKVIGNILYFGGINITGGSNTLMFFPENPQIPANRISGIGRYDCATNTLLPPITKTQINDPLTDPGAICFAVGDNNTLFASLKNPSPAGGNVINPITLIRQYNTTDTTNYKDITGYSANNIVFSQFQNNGDVRFIYRDNDSLILYGAFISVNNRISYNLAKYNLSTETWLPTGNQIESILPINASRQFNYNLFKLENNYMFIFNRNQIYYDPTNTTIIKTANNNFFYEYSKGDNLSLAYTNNEWIITNFITN